MVASSVPKNPFEYNRFAQVGLDSSERDAVHLSDIARLDEMLDSFLRA